MTASVPSGFGESEWRQLVVGTAQRIVSPRLRRLHANDFDTDTAADMNTFGTGTVTYDTGETGGVARLRSGAVVIFVGAGAGVLNAGGGTLVKSPRDESWYTEARVCLRDTALATTRYTCVGMQDTLVGTPEVIGLGLHGDHSTTLLSLVMSVGGGPEVEFMTTIPADISATGTPRYHRYGIGRDAANDKFYATYDRQVVLDLTGPFADLTVNPCFFVSSMIETTVLRDVEMWTDSLATVVEPPE
jgi:hypothetical protein